MNSKDIPAEWLPNYTYQDYEKWEGDWEMIHGIPYAMSPSPKRAHQQAERKCIRLLEDALLQLSNGCDCEVFHGLDWIIDESTVVRPDVMIVCGKVEDDFLRFPPTLIVEITSKRKQIADRNVKRKLYETNGVAYYLIADPERKTTEIYTLVNNSYQLTENPAFSFGDKRRISPDLQLLWR